MWDDQKGFIFLRNFNNLVLLARPLFIYHVCLYYMKRIEFRVSKANINEYIIGSVSSFRHRYLLCYHLLYQRVYFHIVIPAR